MSELSFIARVPIKKMRGIYLLWNNGTVVYVGQSENIMQRIGDHLANPRKDFDAFSYAVVEDGDLDSIEADMIVKYNPRMNKSIPQNHKYATRNYFRKQLGIGGWEFKKITKNIRPVWKDYYLIQDIVEAR